MISILLIVTDQSKERRQCSLVTKGEKIEEPCFPVDIIKSITSPDISETLRAITKRHTKKKNSLRYTSKQLYKSYCTFVRKFFF